MLVAQKEKDVEKNCIHILEDVMAKGKMNMNLGKIKAMIVKRGEGACNVFQGRVRRLRK